MARRRKGRVIHGVILLDKPTGISSNDALQKVKRLYGAEKRDILARLILWRRVCCQSASVKPLSFPNFCSILINVIV